MIYYTGNIHGDVEKRYNFKVRFNIDGTHTIDDSATIMQKLWGKEE